MKRQEILNFVKQNANDVADLAKAYTIETTSDPRLAKIETDALIRKYGDAAETAQRGADFDEIFGEGWNE